MQQLLQAQSLEIQSKIRWFPSLNIRYQVVGEKNEKLGEIILHPAWTTPLLWLFGLLIELGMIAGGVYLVFKGAGNQKWIGATLIALGAIFTLLVKFHSFLSSRAPSTVEIQDANNKTLVKATKGWALWKPTFTTTKADSTQLGQARQSFLWGDCHYILWDDQGQAWGSIRRRPFGFQYRVFKGSEQVAQFRRMFIDARKLMTGIRSYVLHFQNESLTVDERSFVLGTMAFVDVLVRQTLRDKSKNQKSESPKPVQKKKD